MTLVEERVWPGPEYIELVRKTAYRFARKRDQLYLLDDFQSEAVYTLHRDWAAITRRHGATPSTGLVNVTAHRRLTEYCRREYGRRNKPKGHAYAEPLGDLEREAAVDVEAEAIAAMGPTVDELVELVIRVQPAERWRSADRRRLICRRFAEGRSGVAIAAELGISQFSVSRLFTSSLAAARRDPRVRALAMR